MGTKLTNFLALTHDWQWPQCCWYTRTARRKLLYNTFTTSDTSGTSVPLGPKVHSLL